MSKHGSGRGHHRVQPMPERVARQRLANLRTQYGEEKAAQEEEARRLGRPVRSSNRAQQLRGQIKQLEKLIRTKNFSDK